MNKLFLIFFIITTLFFSSCKKEVSLDNVSNQAQLDTLILNNLQIPFEKYDTVFVDEHLEGAAGSNMLTKKYDNINYFTSLQNKIHKPIINTLLA